MSPRSKAVLRRADKRNLLRQLGIASKTTQEVEEEKRKAKQLEKSGKFALFDVVWIEEGAIIEFFFSPKVSGTRIVEDVIYGVSIQIKQHLPDEWRIWLMTDSRFKFFFTSLLAPEEPEQFDLSPVEHNQLQSLRMTFPEVIAAVISSHSTREKAILVALLFFDEILETIPSEEAVRKLKKLGVDLEQK